MIDEILTKLGLKYEDLSEAERQTLIEWSQALNETALSVELIRSYIRKMKEAVENELAIAELNTLKDSFLKARLRNYLLLETFLTSPEKVKKAVEKTLTGIKLDRK